MRIPRKAASRGGGLLGHGDVQVEQCMHARCRPLADARQDDVITAAPEVVGFVGDDATYGGDALCEALGLEFFPLGEVSDGPDVEPLPSFVPWGGGELPDWRLREYPLERGEYLSESAIVGIYRVVERPSGFWGIVSSPMQKDNGVRMGCQRRESNRYINHDEKLERITVGYLMMVMTNTPRIRVKRGCCLLR